MSDDPGAAAAWGLERRLRRQLLPWLLALWVAGAIAALIGMAHEVSEVLDSALTETAQRLLVLPPAVYDDAQAGARDDLFAVHEEFVVYQVFDAERRLRLRSHTAPARPLDAALRDGIREVDGWRVLTLTRGDGALRAQVAETIAHRREILWASAGWLLGALIGVLPIAALILRWLLRRAFSTLEPARAELSARGLDDLGPIAASDAPLELQPWLDTVNALLARVRELVETERAFAAQSAHELRTPLAAARAQAQRISHDATDPAMRTRALALVGQLDRLTRLSSRLLQVARIESGVPLRREPVDLGLLARLVVDEFESVYAAARLVIEAPSARCTIEGDVDALGIALRNLIDNALKHAPASAAVTVRVEVDAISVIDDGPGVASEVLGTLIRPFVRGRVLVEGSGLGLAIVDAIARRSDARLELRSPTADGRGFAATLRFAVARVPKASP